MRTIRVASRKSQLAMTQTKWVISSLEENYPKWNFEIVPITTRGDQIVNVTLSKVGGKGLFVTEIEDVLVNEDADFAVHSLKDVPYRLRDGLALAGIPQAEDPRDAWISKSGLRLDEIPIGAVIGTSSLRRAAQVLQRRPDVVIEPLRGNIDTRLKRAQSGEFDAIILAASGLHRMGWVDSIVDYLAVDVCLPAVGQGILGVECRVNDDELMVALSNWTDTLTRRRAQAERAFLARLEGSCQVPIAGYAEIDAVSGKVTLDGLVADPSGRNILRDRCVGDNPIEVGQALAERLLAMGADSFLQAAQDHEA